MISVTMQFPNEEAVVAFFSKKPVTPIKSPQEAVTAPQSQAVAGSAPAAEQTNTDTPVATKRPGRPRKEQAQPEVAKNTGTSGPELNPPAVSCPPAGAPQGDAGVANEASAAAPSAPAASAAPTTPATLDDTRKAMLAVTEKLGAEVGMKKLNEILVAEAGVKLLRDLPAAKYQAVIEACVKAVAA